MGDKQKGIDIKKSMAYDFNFILELCKTGMETHEEVVPEPRRHESTIKKARQS